MIPGVGSDMRTRVVVLLSAILIAVGCASQPMPVSRMHLDVETTELIGWFSGRGEWTLFPTEALDEGYDPYKDSDDDRCTSVVNATGRPRSDFAHLTGERVFVTGYARAYEKLADGTSAYDKLLSKKYFEGERVENFCLRRLVFIATDVRGVVGLQVR